MTKLFLIVTIIITFGSTSFSQTASDYFPSTPGYIWYYKSNLLDSNNNQIPGSTTYRVDSFSVVQNYLGLNASYVPSKRNLSSVSQTGPYTDSSFFNFQGSNAWQYVDVTRGLDSITFLDTSGLLNFLATFNNWYSVYRFANNVNQSYTIFTKDTTITLQSQSASIRITYAGKRLNDENVITPTGTVSAKKFLLTATLYYLVVLPPPLPPIAVPILSREDTVWVSTGKWMVKESIASTNVDLTNFSIPVQFTVPGESIELTNGPVNIINYSSEIPDKYSLEQNYPNPFNPETKIKFSLPESGYVSLKVYDQSGRETASLISNELNTGVYEYSFNGSGLASGVYYYTLETKGFSETKKMILVK
ncbi:MAG: T9SS type A sorting domain-containing protein [Ignavibacteriae bacterium]|nr:T9SS type A sorting domain-containing protein [Ignavibacteriota bacterium]MCB9243547.1 T9SS type A sorting domain-containing protein [Ignavibacteriales bacterium]